MNPIRVTKKNDKTPNLNIKRKISVNKNSTVNLGIIAFCTKLSCPLALRKLIKNLLVRDTRNIRIAIK